MTDPLRPPNFSEIIEKLARLEEFRAFIQFVNQLPVPGDESYKARVTAVAQKLDADPDDLDEGHVASSSDNEVLAKEALALWGIVREARRLLKGTDGGMREHKSDNPSEAS